MISELRSAPLRAAPRRSAPRPDPLPNHPARSLDLTASGTRWRCRSNQQHDGDRQLRISASLKNGLDVARISGGTCAGREGKNGTWRWRWGEGGEHPRAPPPADRACGQGHLTLHNLAQSRIHFYSMNWRRSPLTVRCVSTVWLSGSMRCRRKHKTTRRRRLGRHRGTRGWGQSQRRAKLAEQRSMRRRS